MHVDVRKWDGSRHWQRDTEFLGEDEHGVWLAAVPGSAVHRPGASFTVTGHFVGCYPRDAGWVAGFWGARADRGPESTRIYVDLTTVPRWADDHTEIRLIDLDLDVVRRWNDVTFLDDEDEFAEHRRLFGYPPQVVAECTAAASALLTQVGSLQGVFAPAVAARWLDTSTALFAGASGRP